MNLSIASVCRDLPGPGNPSGGIFVLRRLAAMASHVNVSVIQPIPWFPIVRALPAFAREANHHQAHGLSIRHAPMFYVPGVLKSLDGLWLYRSVLSQLKTLKVEHGLDLIDAHFGYPEGVGALLAARKLGIPLFVTLRGFEAEYLNKPIIGRQIRYLLRNVDGCICVSHFLKDLALANGAREDATTVIHNAVDSSLFFPGDRIAARRALGLPTEAPIVISVGHLISRKRHHVLIDAFANVLRRTPDARLLIVGGPSFESDYPGRLHKQVSTLGLDDAVTFLGNLDADRVGEYLRAANLFALGTQREGCCNAVLEALACGLPVVTTPVGDNAHFVADGENGFIVDVDDRRGMAKAIVSGLAHGEWDPSHIAASLSVGNWGRVADEVFAFFEERIGVIRARIPSARGAEK